MRESKSIKYNSRALELSAPNLTIGVLMGGWSPEREISLMSGKKVADSLRRQGFKVVEMDIGHNPLEVEQKFIPALSKIGVAFIALHGVPGEDGSIQGMLEVLGIPYTGSGVMASSICMNKIITKKVLTASGIRVPKHVKMPNPSSKIQVNEIKKALGAHPWIVKPVSCGSSVGIRLVKEESELEPAFNKTVEECKEAFIEEFIHGNEVTVGILGDEVLPVAELRPKAEFFDYYAKYTPGVTEDIIPAPIPDEIYKEVQQIGLHAHRAVGCEGFSRVDMRIKDTKIYVLEINSIPGLTDMSILPMEAAHIGISYDEVVYRILEDALNRSGKLI